MGASCETQRAPRTPTLGPGVPSTGTCSPHRGREQKLSPRRCSQRKTPEDTPDGDRQAHGRTETGKAWTWAWRSGEVNAGTTGDTEPVTEAAKGGGDSVMSQIRYAARGTVGEGAPTGTAPCRWARGLALSIQEATPPKMTRGLLSTWLCEGRGGSCGHGAAWSTRATRSFCTHPV